MISCAAGAGGDVIAPCECRITNGAIELVPATRDESFEFVDSSIGGTVDMLFAGGKEYV